MTAKLNQIIAIEKGVKSRTYADISTLYKVVQKPDLFNGFVKNYLKKDEDGEDFPAEKKRVQYYTDEVLHSVSRSMTELMQITARKDWTNCNAVADVVLDGKVVVKGAPVSYLLFLEKQLTDFATLVDNLPILDENEVWKKDAESDLMKSEPVKTHRTKKLQKPIVLFPATPEHPAQTQLITEDVLVGYWEQVKLSGAMSRNKKKEILEKTIALGKAIKEARETANMTDEVATPNVGDSIFSYILGDTKTSSSLD